MLRESVCVEKLEAIIFLVNLLCIYWGRSTAFISHFSLIYSRGTYETSTRKNFGPTKIPMRKNLDLRSTDEEKIWTHKILTKKNFKPTRKNLGPTKYPREKTLDPRYTQEEKLRNNFVHTIHTTIYFLSVSCYIINVNQRWITYVLFQTISKGCRPFQNGLRYLNS